MHFRKLRRSITSEAYARKEEVWRPSLDLNQDKKLCTAPASIFRHRADHNIPQQSSAGESYRYLTLMQPSIF